MKLPGFLRGMPQVARQEFVTNLKSVRLIVMALLSALLIIGGAYGFSSLISGIGGLSPVVVWGHAAYASNGSHVAVVWASDPYGAPFAGLPTTFEEMRPGGTIGQVSTDANGFARLDVGTRDSVIVSVRVGTYESSTSISYFPSPLNFTVATNQGDYDRHGRPDGMAVHVLNATGEPVTAHVRVNDTNVGSVNGYGYLRFSLPLGLSNMTVEVAGQTETVPVYVPDTDGSMPFTSGPDVVLYVIASLSFIVISIFAIVLSFDAVSKERVQGTMDLLLSRPASRTGVLLGKLLGAFGAVALPVTLVNLGGIGAIAAASGKAPTGGFALAFLGFSLLLIALYVLIQLIMSTLAKTAGTAVLFGVLIWLLFNILYSIVTNILGSVLFGGDPATYFRFMLYSGLGNPTSICSMLVMLQAPADLAGSAGTAIDPALPAAAAVVWFVLLLALALWTFHRKAAE